MLYGIIRTDSLVVAEFDAQGLQRFSAPEDIGGRQGASQQARGSGTEILNEHDFIHGSHACQVEVY
ncbi:hypothetical protein E4U53_001407 [Claviceps sorghi]|nr:hypothetical protein E4U53_001407 [Claviceps sorghi]